MSEICLSSFASASTTVNLAISLCSFDLGLHRVPADLAPRVVDRGVREAEVPAAALLGLELGGVDHLRLDHLLPRLVGRRPRASIVALRELRVVVGLDEELRLLAGVRLRVAALARRSRSRRPVVLGRSSSRRRTPRRVPRARQQGDHGGQRQISSMSSVSSSGCGCCRCRHRAPRSRYDGEGDGGDDDDALDGVLERAGDALQVEQREQRLERERAGHRGDAPIRGRRRARPRRARPAVIASNSRPWPTWAETPAKPPSRMPATAAESAREDEGERPHASTRTPDRRAARSLSPAAISWRPKSERISTTAPAPSDEQQQHRPRQLLEHREVLDALTADRAEVVGERAAWRAAGPQEHGARRGSAACRAS